MCKYFQAGSFTLEMFLCSSVSAHCPFDQCLMSFGVNVCGGCIKLAVFSKD